MFATPRLITLSNGDTVACDEYGDPKGRPVFFFHGWPASRLQGAGFGPAAEEFGLRILSPDRPGIGLSTYRPERRLLDWPALIKEVAQAYGIERFSVLAVSGGGPYALVTAWGLPERVEQAFVVSGAVPLATSLARGEILWAYRGLLAIRRKAPGLLRMLFRLARPVVSHRPPHWLVTQALHRFGPAADAEAMRDPECFAGSFACYAEAWRGSALGVAADGEIYGEPWGFQPEEIKVPVSFWHGTHDRSFSAKLVEALAASVPGAKLRLMQDEGHYSLQLRHARVIVEELSRGAASATTGVSTPVPAAGV